MRIQLSILLSVIIIILLSSCIVTDVVYGNKTVTMAIDTLDTFNGEITVDFPTDITIENGKPTVSITTDENIQKYFTIDTTGGNIAIHRSNKYTLVTSEQTVTISVPTLKKITLKDATVIDTIHADSLRSITLTGSAKLTTRVIRRDLSITTADNSTLAITGELKYLTAIHSGNNPLDLSNIPALNAEIECNGSGSITCAITSELRGIIGNSGNIELVSFTPILDIEKNGTGLLIFPADSLLNE